MHRRKYLTTGTLIGLLATSGCLGWRDSGDTGDTEDEEEEEEEQEQEDHHERDEREDADADNHGDHDEDEHKEEDDKDGDEDEDEESNKEDDDYPGPDEEDTEIDRDQYDDPPEQPEREERDSSDVEVDADTDVDDYGGLTIDGTVTNVSDDPIDEVWLDIEVYDPNDEYLWGDSVGIEDLAPDASERFESGWTADEERGELGYVEIDPSVYELVDENENDNGDNNGT